MRAVLVFAVDALLAALIAAAVAIAITGGGAFDVAGAHVSARSVGNPLLACVLIGALRLAVGPSIPFLAVPALTPDVLGGRAAARLGLLARESVPRRAVAIALVVAAASLVVKGAIAWSHPGFFSGDDVEIHEMTLGMLWNRDWPVWELRSAFFPMTCIYPIQRALARFGVSDAGMLVVAGRLVVAAVSSAGAVVIFLVARRHYGARVALIAAVCLAFNHLSVTFGATELPRPVAATLLAAAFGCVMRSSSAGAMAGGALVGVAAAMRFSEVLFVVPGVLHLLFDRRARHAAMFVTAAVVVAGVIQAVSDQLYWGAPYSSALRVIDYTLVARQSSRGFEPLWHYVTSVPSWSDPVLAGLALVATVRGGWRPGLWAWTPLVLLSLMPHKEARYLVPIMPFVSLLAAVGLTELISAVVTRPLPTARRARFALLLAAALGASALLHASRFHVRRDDGAVQVAKALATRQDIQGLAVEQLWRMGGRIYLDRIQGLQDIDPARLGTASDALAVVTSLEANWIALRQETCDRLDCVPLLRSVGFIAVEEWTGHSEYVVFRRVR